jgi:putative peptidoglycan lipid II flippase
VAEGPHGGRRSAVVAAGILASRLFGFFRQRAVAHFFGTSPHADVFVFALRAPNILQNLLGEGTLSASFIPVYSRMLEEGREEDAGRLAGAVFGLLLALAAGLSLLGVLFAEPIVAVLAAGFLGDTGAVDRFPLAVTALRITFPMVGILVLHAWALGVLNSHRRFFLPYVAPVLWNGAIIAALVLAGHFLVAGPTGAGGAHLSVATLDRLLYAACLGGLAGGLLQFVVQLPLVFRVLRGFRLSWSTRIDGVRRTLSAFWPVVSGRGVVQLGAWLDLFLASYLAEGAVGVLGFAQLLYILPISLFAMSVAAAELPELSRLSSVAPGGGAGADGGPPVTPDAAWLGRIEESVRQIALLVVPTFVGYLAFGYLLVGAIYRTGSFGAESNLLVYAALAAYTLGLPASAGSRLFQNVFFSLSNTRTPAKIAAQRVFLAAIVAVPAMLALDRMPVPGGDGALQTGLRLGAVGLALGSAVGAWYEIIRLLRTARRHVRTTGGPAAGFAAGVAPALGRMLATAVGAAVPATLLWWILPPLHPALAALIVVGVYAGLYLAGARLFGFPELETWLGRWTRRFRKS